MSEMFRKFLLKLALRTEIFLKLIHGSTLSYIWRSELTEGFCVTSLPGGLIFGGAYTWMGWPEGLIFGILW